VSLLIANGRKLNHFVLTNAIQGGVKGIVWLDVLHLLVIVLGIILLMLLGVAEVGNLQEVVNMATDGLRMGHNV
jgi:Na+/proline symporter